MYENYLDRMLSSTELKSGNKVSPEQLSLLQEFNSYLRGQNISACTRKNYIVTLRCVSNAIGKNLDKSITKNDIEVWLSSIGDDAVQSKIVKIATVKKYFKWLYHKGTSDMKKRSLFPEVVDFIENPNNKVEKRLTSSDLLSQEEVKRMIDACPNTRDRTIISLLFDSGLRRQELCNLNVGDIHITINEQYLTVRNVEGNKTGGRIVPLNYSISDIKDWLNVHPKKNDINAPLFICLEHSIGRQRFRYGERLGGNRIITIVKRTAKDAGINKRVFTHLFRHSRNTDLEDKGAPRSARICMFGWSEKSNMPEHYSHLSKEQNLGKIRQADGLLPKAPQVIDILKPIQCPRCNEQNSPVNRFCGKCATPLDEQSIQKIIIQSIVETTVENLFNKKPELQELAKREMLANPDLKKKLSLIKNPEIQKLLAAQFQ
jgi:site-specific recombinase XerD